MSWALPDAYYTVDELDFVVSVVVDGVEREDVDVEELSIHVSGLTGLSNVTVFVSSCFLTLCTEKQNITWTTLPTLPFKPENVTAQATSTLISLTWDYDVIYATGERLLSLPKHQPTNGALLSIYIA